MKNIFELEAEVAVVTGALGKLGSIWIEALLDAGAASSFASLPGGFNDPAAGPCDALTYHGFLGIENAAVGNIADWIDSVLTALKH